MNKIIVAGLVTVAMALAGCGPKASKTTTPENKGGSTTDTKGTGGQTYGGGSGTAPMKPTGGGGGDPCGG